MGAEQNLVLCGFMGCGKTVLGKLIAQRLGRRFADTDLLIEKRAGMRIPEIFRLNTEQGFRDREHEAILELASHRGVVISTGGGVFDYPRNVAILRESGLVLFLDAPFDECYARIADTDRPLVRQNSREGLRALYHRRLAGYREGSDLQLSINGPPGKWIDAAMALIDP